MLLALCLRPATPLRPLGARMMSSPPAAATAAATAAPSAARAGARAGTRAASSPIGATVASVPRRAGVFRIEPAAYLLGPAWRGVRVPLTGGAVVRDDPRDLKYRVGVAGQPYAVRDGDWECTSCEE